MDKKINNTNKILFVLKKNTDLNEAKKEAALIYGESNCIIKTVTNIKNLDDQITPDEIINDIAPEGKVIIYLFQKKPIPLV